MGAQDAVLEAKVISYRQLTRFLLPLVFTIVVQALSGQVLNGGMARVPRATETLAGFGLAWGLVTLLASPLTQVRQLGLVLADHAQANRQLRFFVVGAGALLAGILATLAIGAPGKWIVETLHGISSPLSDVVREALGWLIPYPLLRGLTLYYSGLLLRARRTDLVSFATLASIAASILSVVLVLPTEFVGQRPILLPVFVTYIGAIVEFSVIVVGCRGFIPQSEHAGTGELSLSYIVRFFWPLALIMFIQGLSRPLINLFVSREAGGAESLAILTVVYSLAHMFYGWLNEIRNLPPAFRDKPGSQPRILRFALICGLISFGSMATLFWTPLKVLILGRLIGVEPSLVAGAATPLVIFSFFPLSVMLRAYLHGIGLLEHRTGAMAPSAPARILAVLASLLIFPALGVNGASRGVAALLSGFLVETVVVWWGVRGRRRFAVARQLVPDAGSRRSE